jgi:hypothetical protein
MACLEAIILPTPLLTTTVLSMTTTMLWISVVTLVIPLIAMHLQSPLPRTSMIALMVPLTVDESPEPAVNKC